MVKRLLAAAVLSATLTGCMTAAEHARQLPAYEEREMTVGVVQKDIRKGMSQAEVAEALGSPNIVTRDKNGMETWIYDKLATEAAYSESSGSILSLFIGQRRSGAASTTRKTLTVLIKFRDGLVQDYSYHSSKF